MQDVCISFWPEGETPKTSAFPDMIAKVTDICSTDPNDPTYCATPSDIKLDRAKVQVMYSIPSPGKDDADLQKPVYPKGTFWHLTKCVSSPLPSSTVLPIPLPLPWSYTLHASPSTPPLTETKTVDKRPPPTRLPRQLVRPAPLPQQLHVQRRRHPPAMEEQSEVLPRQRLGHLSEWHGDPDRGGHRRHHGAERLGAGAGAEVGAYCWGEGVWHTGEECGWRAGAVAWEKYGACGW